MSFDPENLTAQRVSAVLAARGVEPEMVLVANIAPMLCQFVAGGHGVSLAHPLMAQDAGERLVVRPFEPAIPYDFCLCRPRAHAVAMGVLRGRRARR